MSGILAIEPSVQRRGLLAALLREHAKADVTIVASVQAAIAVFERRQPDVVVAPALLSPEDSARLSAYVREQAAPHVQMFTASALDILAKVPDSPSDSRWWVSKRRRASTRSLPYDPTSLGRQIADCLDQAQLLRQQETSSWHVDSPLDGNAQITAVAVAAAIPSEPMLRTRSERRRAERIGQRAPWNWSVQLPWQAQIDVTNISESGILLESTTKVASGVTLDLRLNGMGLDRIVPARIVRSDVARVDSRGVRYRLAAQFERPLDLLTRRPADTPEPTPAALAELFATTLSQSLGLGNRSAHFARGLRALVSAREIFIQQAPMAPSDDSESIYFTVSAHQTKPMVLQVLFDPDRPPTPIEFALLKAAVPTTVAMLELERIGTSFLATAGVA